MTVVNPKSISGINSITTGSGSDNLLTIHTSDASSTERVRINSSGDVIVGSGITVSPDGDIFATGVCTATSFVGDGANLTNVDVVSDTSPQLGGNLDVNTKNIVFGDSGSASDDRLTFGAGTDLSIYHDGTDSIIDNNTGNLNLICDSAQAINLRHGSENMIRAITDGAVELYYDNSKKFETTSTGATLSGNLSIDANIIHNGDTDTMLSFSTDNQVDIKCSDTVIGKFTTNGLALGDNKRLDIFDASGDRSGLINNSDSGANALRISADPDNSGSNSSLQFHVDGTERARVDSTGDLTISDGDLVIGTAGHGIDFSGTGGPTNGSDTAELFDDYEEGTWSPGIDKNASSMVVSYSNSSGTYTKIGRAVFVWFDFTVSSTSNSGSGVPYVAGLPYVATATSNDGGYGAPTFRDATLMDTDFRIYGSSSHVGGSAIYLYKYNSSGTQGSASVQSTGRLTGQAFYFTTS